MIGHPKIIKLNNIFEYKQLLFLIMEKIKKYLLWQKNNRNKLKLPIIGENKNKIKNFLSNIWKIKKKF